MIILDICVILSFILLSIPKIGINGKVVKYIITNTDFYIIILSSIITISCLIALLDYIKRYKETRYNPKYIRVKKRKNAETTKEAPADFIMLKIKITKETAAAK